MKVLIVGNGYWAVKLGRFLKNKGYEIIFVAPTIPVITPLIPKFFAGAFSFKQLLYWQNRKWEEFGFKYLKFFVKKVLEENGKYIFSNENDSISVEADFIIFTVDSYYESAFELETLNYQNLRLNLFKIVKEKNRPILILGNDINALEFAWELSNRLPILLLSKTAYPLFNLKGNHYLLLKILRKNNLKFIGDFKVKNILQSPITEENNLVSSMYGEKYYFSIGFDFSLKLPIKMDIDLEKAIIFKRTNSSLLDYKLFSKFFNEYDRKLLPNIYRLKGFIRNLNLGNYILKIRDEEFKIEEK